MQRNIINTLVRGMSKLTIEKPPNSIFSLYLRENYYKLKLESESNSLPFDKKTLMDMVREQYKKISLEERKELEGKLRIVTEDYIKMKNMDSETKESFAETHGLPKKPMQSILNIYIQDMFANKQIYPDLKTKDKFKQVVHDFKNITESELKTYSDRFSTMKADYETLLKEWTKAKNVPLFNTRKKIAYYFYYKENYNR